MWDTPAATGFAVLQSPATWPEFYVHFGQTSASTLEFSMATVRFYDTWDSVTHTGTGGTTWLNTNSAFGYRTAGPYPNITSMHVMETADTLVLSCNTGLAGNAAAGTSTLVFAKFTPAGGVSIANPVAFFAETTTSSEYPRGRIYQDHTGAKWTHAANMLYLDLPWSGANTPTMANPLGSTYGDGFLLMDVPVAAMQIGTVNFLYYGVLRGVKTVSRYCGDVLNFTSGTKNYKCLIVASALGCAGGVRYGTVSASSEAFGYAFEY